MNLAVRWKFKNQFLKGLFSLEKNFFFYFFFFFLKKKISFDKETLTVVVPAYNEEERIEIMLDDAFQWLDKEHKK